MQHLKMACHLLSSDGCNNLPDLARGLHVGDALEATAAPLPSSAALQTEHAWPGADVRQTCEESDLEALEGKQLQTADAAASRDREGDQRVGDWGLGHQGRGIGPNVVRLPAGPPEDEDLNLDRGGPAGGDAGGSECESAGDDEGSR